MGQHCCLAGPEAHHLLHVLRVKPGESLTLFDGSGREFTAQVARVSRRDVEVEIVAVQEVNRELAAPLTLIVALPKGDRQRWLVEKCVELGVAELRPLASRRTVAEPGERTPDRLTRYVIEASKQCGRNRLMQIGELWDLASETNQPALAPGVHCVADPQAQQSWTAVIADRNPTMATVLIGPEGGWTDDERERLQSAGWLAIGLGSRILRVETAALAIAAHWAGWQS